MAEITINDIIKAENLVYKPSKIMTDTTLSYCPGCGHGTAHQLIAHVIEEMEIQEITKALELTNNNKTAAAKVLGISFRALRYRIKKLNID